MLYFVTNNFISILRVIPYNVLKKHFVKWHLQRPQKQKFAIFQIYILLLQTSSYLRHLEDSIEYGNQMFVLLLGPMQKLYYNIDYKTNNLSLF